jgi:hypothetical protein
MNREIGFQQDIAKMRREQELITVSTVLGKELIYSMKVATGAHFTPENVRIVKINPMIMGIKDHVVK